MKIQFKLILVGFVVIAVLMAMVGFVGIRSTQEVGERFNEIVDFTTPSIQALTEIKAVAREIQMEGVSFALIGAELKLTEEGAAAAAAAAEKNALLESIKEIEKWEEEYQKHITPGEEDELAFATAIDETEEKLEEIAKELITLKEQGISGQQILDKKEEMEEAEVNFEAIIDRAIANETAELKEQDELADAAAAAAARILTVGVIAAVLLALGMGVFVSRSVAKPLKELRDVAAQITAGDFSVRAKVRSKDEIGQLAGSFNQMVENLLGAEKYTQNIVQSMPTSLIVVEPNAKIKSVNPITCELLGYTEKQLVGQPIEKIFGAAAAAAAAAAAENIFKGAGLDKLIKEGTIKDELMMYLTKKGEEIPVSVSGSVMYDEKGKLQYIVVVAKDLREIKKYAAERLAKLTPILRKAAMGDFSENVEIPEREDEFTEVSVALSLMVDDLRETVGKNVELVKALEKEKVGLEQKVKERTQDIDASNQQLKAANQQMNAANQQLSAAQKNLQDKLLELERFNKVAVGRELKMVELKEEIARLKAGSVKNTPATDQSSAQGTAQNLPKK